jgi:hypothetical protein
MLMPQNLRDLLEEVAAVATMKIVAIKAEKAVVAAAEEEEEARVMMVVVMEEIVIMTKAEIIVAVVVAVVVTVVEQVEIMIIQQQKNQIRRHLHLRHHQHVNKDQLLLNAPMYQNLHLHRLQDL